MSVDKVTYDLTYLLLSGKMHQTTEVFFLMMKEGWGNKGLSNDKMCFLTGNILEQHITTVLFK